MKEPQKWPVMKTCLNCGDRYDLQMRKDMEAFIPPRERSRHDFCDKCQQWENRKQ